MPPMSELPGGEIKARKKFLYEGGREGLIPTDHSRKSLSDHLRETPSTPLSAGVKIALIISAIAVGLTFMASLWKMMSGKPTLKPLPQTTSRS